MTCQTDMCHESDSACRQCSFEYERDGYYDDSYEEEDGWKQCDCCDMCGTYTDGGCDCCDNCIDC